jgi:hypothetical protein
MFVSSILQQPQPHLSRLLVNKVIKSKASFMDWIAKSGVKCFLALLNSHNTFMNFYQKLIKRKLLSKYLDMNKNLKTDVPYILCDCNNIWIRAMQ